MYLVVPPLSSIITTRVPPISVKLSDQFLNLSIVRHCPKGQLGQIWVNLGQN